CSSVSGFRLFALEREGAVAGEGTDGLPALVVVVVIGTVWASNSARATFWLPGVSFWYAPAAGGGGATCASAVAAPNSSSIAATWDASPISASGGLARGKYRLVAAPGAPTRGPPGGWE